VKPRGREIGDGGWRSRSVLECGSPLPLSHGGEYPVAAQSARGLAHSKTWRSFVAALVFLATAIIASAQSYSIDWFTIDGGGGTSTGGVYSVSGTIGQPDAGGPMTNGQYSVTGGFWALPTAVQVTNAPTLTIVPAAPGQATISWTPNTPGFVLQETWVLSPANWTNSPSGATNPITVPATLPTKFYRLFKP
jgi:hypothetical protein